MHGFFHKRRALTCALRGLLLFACRQSAKAVSFNVEVNSGAALLQTSRHMKTPWNQSQPEQKHSGLEHISLMAPQKSYSTVNSCSKYWRGRREGGDCPAGCRSPEVATGASWNGGKELENDVCTFFASMVYDEVRRYCGEGPNYMHETGLDCRGCASNSTTDTKSFHDIVGGDGVYMISLNCHTERFEFSAARLKEVGITPLFFPATETSAPVEELAQGCLPKADAQCESEDKPGPGCVDSTEQAIADSHRRAIVAAINRDAEWTAILEDDCVPAMFEDGQWTDRLMQVWTQIPEGTDVVRLGWCGLEDPAHRWQADSSNFVIADTPDPGGCTHAYVVRRSALPKLAAVFPCCCAVDCCFKFGMPAQGLTMVNIDAAGSKEYIASRMTQDWGNAYGIMMQAKADLPTVRGR